MRGEDLEDARILDVATRLFAGLGFDSTSMTMIAESSGITPDALTAKVGTKTELYTAVIGRARQLVRDRLAKIPAVLDPPTRQGLARTIDITLDAYADNPLMLKLWLQHRIGDASDLGDVEGQALLPGYSWYANLLRDAAPEDLDIDYILTAIRWLIEGFLSGGIIHSDPEQHPGHPQGLHHTASDLEDFRAFLKQAMHRLLPLPEEF